MSKLAPRWVMTLQMAQEWGTPPWEIEADETPVVWLERWIAYKPAESKRAEIEAARKHGGKS